MKHTFDGHCTCDDFLTHGTVHVYAGDRFLNEMPHSEVCTHMRIAGKMMECELVGERMVQLYDAKTHQPFSAPITRGEAGVFEDAQGPYIRYRYTDQ